MNRPLVTLLAALTASLSSAGEIADLHLQRAGAPANASTKSRPRDETTSTQHGITEIGIERTPCFGRCPTYTFIARSDGTFRYKGDRNVERLGEFTGTIPVGYFRQLAQFIRDSGYAELDDYYAQPITDLPYVYTMVVTNGKRKTVRNYANAGPAKLWAIEALIDEMLTKATWDGPPKPAGEKK